MSESTKNKSVIIAKTVVKPVIKTVAATKTKQVAIPRNISSDGIADEIASRISGTLVNLEDVYDVKTGQFVGEDKLRASGCTFTSVDYRKNVTGELLKKDRVTKEPLKYSRVEKSFSAIILTEINWKKFVEKRSTYKTVDVADKRSNGVENYHCQAIGETRAGNKTINGVVFKITKKTEYRDENGDLIDRELLVNFLPKAADPAKQEKKYGISADKMPQYRTVRIDNCDRIRAFGFEFIPTPE